MQPTGQPVAGTQVNGGAKTSGAQEPPAVIMPPQARVGPGSWPKQTKDHDAPTAPPPPRTTLHYPLQPPSHLLQPHLSYPPLVSLPTLQKVMVNPSGPWRVHSHTHTFFWVHPAPHHHTATPATAPENNIPTSPCCPERGEGGEDQPSFLNITYVTWCGWAVNELQIKLAWQSPTTAKLQSPPHPVCVVCM